MIIAKDRLHSKWQWSRVFFVLVPICGLVTVPRPHWLIWRGRAFEYRLSNKWRTLKPTWRGVQLFLHPFPGFANSQLNEVRFGLPTKPFFSSCSSGDAHAPCTEAGTAIFPTHTITMDYYCSCASLLNPIYIFLMQQSNPLSWLMFSTISWKKLCYKPYIHHKYNSVVCSVITQKGLMHVQVCSRLVGSTSSPTTTS